MQPRNVGVKRSILAQPFDDRCPIFTEQVEEECRGDAWKLHKELHGHIEQDKFFVQDSRPFYSVQGHTASKARLRFTKPERKYVVDSGASLHIIGWRNTSTTERRTARKSSRIYNIQTANGMIQADWECYISVEDLQISVWAIMTNNDSPPILSLGRLCHESGFSYEWPEDESPFLTKTSTGARYYCNEENFVPMVHVGKHTDEVNSSEEFQSLDEESTSAGGDLQQVSEGDDADVQD